MNRILYQWLTWLLWLALPLTALRYWLAWDHLPARVATHFNASGEPNGWMTRETSLIFAVVLMVFLLTILTAVLYVLQRKQATDAFFLGLPRDGEVFLGYHELERIVRDLDLMMQFAHS